MKILEREQLISEQELLEFEEQFVQGGLPSDYKEFILLNNGGVPELPYFIAGDGESYSVYNFYSIKFGEDLIEETLDDWREHIEFPNHLIPFAYDGGGFPFCLNLEDGSVTFVSMEDGLNYIRLADSFSAFINALTEDMG